MNDRLQEAQVTSSSIEEELRDTLSAMLMTLGLSKNDLVVILVLLKTPFEQWQLMEWIFRIPKEELKEWAEQTPQLLAEAILQKTMDIHEEFRERTKATS